MDEKKINELITTVIQQLAEAGVGFASLPQTEAPVRQPLQAAPEPATPPAARTPQPVSGDFDFLKIDLADPTVPALRYHANVAHPKDAQAAQELADSTSARIAVGRAGPRYPTGALLLFQGDHAVTQDALYRDVDQHLLDEFGLLSVQTRITEGKEQYLLRPDLGRQLDDASKRLLLEKCVKGANIQIAVGDGLSATAIEANLRQIFPVIRQGAQSAGLSLGIPFFIKYCRVGVMNDIGDLLKPDVVILLIGERPGLGRAESMSAYMGYHPHSGNNDADRDVICNIFENGGTNPLEAGAFIVQMAQKMLANQASGVKLKLAVR